MISVLSHCRKANRITRLALPWSRISAIRSSSTKSPNPVEEVEPPVRYLASPAATWKAKSSRTYGTDDQPECQTYVVVASVAVFMLYFCILREESDIDIELGKSLYDRVPGMEKQQLIKLHRKLLDDGQSVVEVENRLKELLVLEKSQGQK